MLSHQFFKELESHQQVTEVYTGTICINAGVVEDKDVKKWAAIVHGPAIAYEWQLKQMERMGIAVDWDEAEESKGRIATEIQMDYRHFLWLQTFMQFGDIMDIKEIGVKIKVPFPKSETKIRRIGTKILNGYEKNSKR